MEVYVKVIWFEQGCIDGLDLEVVGELVSVIIFGEFIFVVGVIGLLQLLEFFGIGDLDVLEKVGVEIRYVLLLVGENLQDYL